MFYRILNKLAYCVLTIKWAYQRVYRGYDDRVYTNVDEWLSEIMPEIFRKIADNKGKYCEELEGIANGFEAHYILNNATFNIIGLDKKGKPTVSEQAKKQIKHLEGMQKKGLSLFAKHFDKLWE